MGKRENLLAYIERIKAEGETVKTYGEGWKILDWKTRQSIKAGEICLTVSTLTQAEAKAKRHPRSIGARKARQKAKAYRRRLKRLEAELAESYSNYNVNTPQYITTPGAGYNPSQSQLEIIRKDCKETSYYVD